MKARKPKQQVGRPWGKKFDAEAIVDYHGERKAFIHTSVDCFDSKDARSFAKWLLEFANWAEKRET